MAIRDNRIAAESVGLNVTKYRMIAFVTASALAGAAGALYGLNYGVLVSSRFDFKDEHAAIQGVTAVRTGGDVQQADIGETLMELLRPEGKISLPRHELEFIV